MSVVTWLDRGTWSTEYGGGGLSRDQNRVLQQELGRINARPALRSFGLMMLGPALLESPDKKRITCPRSSKAKSGGARVTANRGPGLIWPACVPVPKIWATTTL